MPSKAAMESKAEFKAFVREHFDGMDNAGVLNILADQHAALFDKHVAEARDVMENHHCFYEGPPGSPVCKDCISLARYTPQEDGRDA